MGGSESGRWCRRVEGEGEGSGRWKGATVVGDGSKLWVKESGRGQVWVDLGGWKLAWVGRQVWTEVGSSLQDLAGRHLASSTICSKSALNIPNIILRQPRNQVKLAVVTLGKSAPSPFYAQKHFGSQRLLRAAVGTLYLISVSKGYDSIIASNSALLTEACRVVGDSAKSFTNPQVASQLPSLACAWWYLSTFHLSSHLQMLSSLSIGGVRRATF